MSQNFRQDNPFLRSPAATTGDCPFRPTKDLRQFVVMFRLALLAVRPTSQPYVFRGYERRRAVRVTVSARSQAVGRATIDDAYALSYVASQVTRTFNNSLCPGMFVEIEPCTMLGELGMPASSAACERVVASLRRIAMTDVSVHNWGDNAIAEQGPLLTIEARANKSWFIVSVPDWLQDEVNAGRIVKALPEALTLSGQRARLYGWARGWLGRKVGDVRFITKREALARADSDADAWDALMEATAADDVPGYQISSDVFEGQPAIAIAHRAAPAPAQTFHSIEIDLDPDMTEDWFSRLSTSPNPPLVEIEI